MTTPTPILLDCERSLLYRGSSVVRAERHLGESMNDSLQKMGLARLVTYLWAGLLHADERLTVNKTEALLDRAIEQGQSYMDLWNRVAEALRNSGIIRLEERLGDDRPPLAPDPGSSAA